VLCLGSHQNILRVRHSHTSLCRRGPQARFIEKCPLEVLVTHPFFPSAITSLSPNKIQLSRTVKPPRIRLTIETDSSPIPAPSSVTQITPPSFHDTHFTGLNKAPSPQGFLCSHSDTPFSTGPFPFFFTGLFCAPHKTATPKNIAFSNQMGPVSSPLPAKPSTSPVPAFLFHAVAAPSKNDEESPLRRATSNCPRL